MNLKLSLHALLVESAHGDIAPLQAMLKEASATHELAHADTLEDNMLHMEAGAFDVALVDLAQPDIDSLEIISRLREHALEIPVLIISDLDDDNIALAAVRAGAQDYLVKGAFDTRLLLRAIRYAIERNHTQITLHALSLLDDLTGVYNRRGFMTLAEHQIRVSQRRHIGFHLIFIDLDGMKQINDSNGHLAGDQALIAIAQLLSYTFRGSDVVARMGGDEFAVITCNIEQQSPDITAPIIARLEAAIAQHNHRHFDEPSLSISYGAIFFDPAENKPLDQMLLEADQIMYECKRRKKQQKLAAFGLQAECAGNTLLNFGIP